MVTIKNKVTNGASWCPVSHGVSPKGSFRLFRVKIAGKFFSGKNSFLLSSNANEVIRAVLNSLFFLQKDFTHTHTQIKAQNAHKETKIKRAAFYPLKKL